MSNLEDLREKASLYTLAGVKKKLDGAKPMGSGLEGEVYVLDEDLAVKLRRRKGVIFNSYKDNLAEYQRQAIHDTVNSLTNRNLSWKINRWGFPGNDVNSRLIDILACFIDGKESVSIMPRMHTHTLNYNSQIDGMFEAYKAEGVAIDIHGENVMPGNLYSGYPLDVTYTVLETCGGIHPDIFKAIERRNPKNKKEVLEHLAKAHLLGATNYYPTPHGLMVGTPYLVEDPVMWHDISLVAEANNYSEINRSNLGQCLERARKALSPQKQKELSPWGLNHLEWSTTGLPALEEARKLFGPQFAPVKFDWDSGTTLEAYGISPEIYNQFIKSVDTIRPQVEPIIKKARRAIKR